MITSLLYYRSIWTNEPIPDPTPYISLKFAKIRNISQWIYNQTQKTPAEIIEYYTNVFDNENYEHDSDEDISFNVSTIFLQ